MLQRHGLEEAERLLNGERRDRHFFLSGDPSSEAASFVADASLSPSLPGLGPHFLMSLLFFVRDWKRGSI